MIDLLLHHLINYGGKYSILIFNILFITMGKIFKLGRVVVLTSGRFAGKKALVVRTVEGGNKRHRFAHLLVVGIARNPKKITRSLGKKKFIKRTGVKPFIKSINQSHVIPTRFIVNDFDLKEFKDEESINDKVKKMELLKKVKTAFSTTYRNLPDIKTNDKAGNVKFFFSKLRF